MGEQQRKLNVIITDIPIFLAHWNQRLTWWAYSISRLRRRPHFRTNISPRPVGRFLSNFIRSIFGVRKGCSRFWGRSDQNCSYHGNRKLPLTYNGKNGVPEFSQSLIIRSLSNLQVTRTGIKSRMSLNLGRVGLFTTELFTLEHSHWLSMGKTVSPSFLSYYEFSLHQTYR